MSDAVGQLKSKNLGDQLAAGKSLLAAYFDGEPYGWRSGGRSLRDLSREIGVSLSSLYRCMAVTSMLIECGDPPLEHLGMTHLRELLSLDRDRQLELLQRAESEQWTVAQIRLRAKSSDRRDSIRPGRAAVAPSASLVSLIEQWTGSKNRMHGMEAVARLSAAERADLLRSIHQIQMELEMLEYRLAVAR